MSLSSGYAVAAITGPPGSSNAHPVPMIDIGSTTMVPKPTRADLLLELAEARQAFLEAEADLDYTSDPEPEFCHSVDVGGGPVSLGQPSPSTARESPSTGVYSPPLPTTTSTPTRYPVDIFDALDSVYMPCVSSASAETAAGLSRTRPAVQPPITALSSASAETIATDTVPPSITVADIHQSRVLQRNDELCVTGGRTAGIACGVSRGLKSMRCSSSLPPVLTTVRDDKGSGRITDGESSLVHHHRERGTSCSVHSVPAPVLAASSASAEMQQGGNGGYPSNLTLAQRIDAFIPTRIDVPSSLPRKGCNGWTMPDLEFVGDKTIVDFPLALRRRRRNRGTILQRRRRELVHLRGSLG